MTVVEYAHHEAGARPRTGDDLLWNWARWTWAGETVGNMARYVPWEDTFHPILVDDALAVDRLYRELRRHEAMVVTAEYPQKNVRFAGMDRIERRDAAIRWVRAVLGVSIPEAQYWQIVLRFRGQVERVVL